MQQSPLFITSETFNPHDFDKILVQFSGGKDSIACFLHLLELGVPRTKIEIWHQRIDGDGPPFMDWPITDDYVRKFAQAFEVPLYYGWKVGGFEREMNRENSLTAPMAFETPTGLQVVGGTRGKPSTRRKFPQVSPDLSVRWCSSYLKISVCAAAISNQSRFDTQRVLVVTGERAEESAARAKYQIAEPHRTHTQTRIVWHWRPIHGWCERRVWDLIAKYRVNPHPGYRLGFGRLSCLLCVFASPNQWASASVVAPQRVIKIAKYEKSFGVTLRRDGPIENAVRRGVPYKMNSDVMKLAMSDTFSEPIIVQNWTLPLGAFGENAGPT